MIISLLFLLNFFIIACFIKPFCGKTNECLIQVVSPLTRIAVTFHYNLCLQFLLVSPRKSIQTIHENIRVHAICHVGRIDESGRIRGHNPEGPEGPKVLLQSVASRNNFFWGCPLHWCEATEYIQQEINNDNSHKTVKSRLTFISAFSLMVTVTLMKTAVAKNLSQSIIICVEHQNFSKNIRQPCQYPLS